MFISFVYLFLHMYVSLYDCCLNSNSPNNGLVRQVSGVHELTFVPMSVCLLECVQQGTELHICDHVNWVIRVWSVGYTGLRLCPRQFSCWDTSVFCQLRVCFVVIVPSLLSYCQLRVRFFFYSMVIDAQREGT